MNARCRNPRKVYYHGRGIKVCERWRGKNGFANFLADMGERPAGMTLDRKDNDGPYSPENCRWVTASQQSRNTRANRLITYDGRTQTVAAWAEEVGLKWATLGGRLDGGWPVEKALKTTPRKMLTHDGRTMSLMDWAAEKGIGTTLLYQRLLRGWPVARALTTPARKKKRRADNHV